MMHSSLNGTRTIAFVSNNCWSLINFRKEVLQYFLGLGYRVLAIAPDDEYADDIRSMGCIFYPVDFRNSATSPIKDILLYFSLLKIYRKEKPGIVFHYVIKPCIYGSMAAGKLNIPSVSVITGLGYVFSGGNWLQHPVQFLFKRAMVHAKQVWFLNHENASYFEQHSIISKDKIRILPGEGIDTNKFSPAAQRQAGNPFIFLMVSRLLWSKGLGIYMEAARILRSRGVDAEFRLLGKPEKGHPESVPDEQLIDWEKQGLLVNLGFREDVRQTLSEADCLVLPTYYEEGIPRTLLEAGSMEIPSITTDLTGSHSVVEDNVNGLLCRPRDARDLADKMITMISLGNEKRKEMGQNGRKKILAEFDLKAVIAMYSETVIHYQHGHIH
jgi:glycosyltransferase involved in cell wall biosynthesis